MENERPNLIYVFADQLRYRSVGYNGDEMAKTPNIDDFSDRATIMENACSGHPVCAPYRASLMTGKYTTSTGMIINEIRINPNHKTFANVLCENGYETSYIGKWHMYAAQLGHHYDVKNSYIPKGPDRLGFDGFFAGYNFHHEYYAPKAYYHLDSPKKIYCKKFEPDEQTDLAIERIKFHEKSGKPFALFLSIGTPHDPWTAENVPSEYFNKFRNETFELPKNYSKKNDSHADAWAKFLPGKRKKITEWMKVYYAMVNNLDMNFGRLLDFIENEGIAKDTIIVFTSDHGEMFGAHGRHAKNIFYEEAVRVPFLIKYGDRLKSGKCLTCFNSPDIMPTLLSMMNLPIPKEVEGTDISQSIISGDFVENNCLMMGTGPTAIYGNGNEWRAIRSERFTYAIYKKDGQGHFYDNLADEFQMRNLAGDEHYKTEMQELKNQMYAKMKLIGDKFESNSYYKNHWVKDRKILPVLTRE